MTGYLADYHDHLKRRGLTDGYIVQVTFQIKCFLNYLQDQGAEAITRNDVSNYASYLKREARNERGSLLRPRLIARRLQAVKQFAEYLVERKLFLLNPARDLIYPKPDRLPAYVPSHAELSRMIDSIPPVGFALRDKAILEVLYSSGLRAGELIHLDLYDIDFETKRILVREGKGAKDRVLPLGDKALAALRAYVDRLRACWIKQQGASALFLSRRGRRITYKVLIDVIHRYRTNPGIRPHTMRHACALGMLRNGADIRYLQELLGHERLETTQIYTRLSPLEVKEAHTRFHPRRFFKRERLELDSKTQENAVSSATRQKIPLLFAF